MRSGGVTRVCVFGFIWCGYFQVLRVFKITYLIIICYRKMNNNICVGVGVGVVVGLGVVVGVVVGVACCAISIFTCARVYLFGGGCIKY